MTMLACLALMQENPCSVSIAVSHVQAKAGQTVDAVVQVEPEKGWHVYWSNPGDSGMAPTVKWHLPAGFKVEGPDFPTPSVLKDEAGTTFIYDRPLALVYHITSPTGFKDPSFKISGDVSYLVCKAKCLTGEGSVEATVSMGDDPADSPDADRVNEAIAAIPRPADPGSVTVSKQGNDVQLEWKTGTPRSAMDPYFFPSDEASFAFAGQKWKVDGNKITGVIQVHPDAASRPKRIRGLLAWVNPTDLNPNPKLTVNIDLPMP